MSLLTSIPSAMYEVCDNDIALYDMGKPFVAGDHIWATDGRILLRLPVVTVERDVIEPLKINRGRFLDPMKAWDSTTGNDVIVVLPTSSTSILCSQCGGKEYTECYSCHGLRKEYVDDEVICGHLMLGNYYVDFLIKHGVKSVLANRDPHRAVRFIFGQIEGILMPRKT